VASALERRALARSTAVTTRAKLDLCDVLPPALLPLTADAGDTDVRALL
jgi:hypothetical protein